MSRTGTAWGRSAAQPTEARAHAPPRSAPGAGAEATGIAADTVARTTALLSRDRAALVAFVLALLERAGTEQREYAAGAAR